MMSRDTSLSDDCTPDCCENYNLIIIIINCINNYNFIIYLKNSVIIIINCNNNFISIIIKYINENFI